HLSVFFLEAVDAAFGIDQLLLAGEERMAAGADFHADIALMRGARLELVAAGANHIHFFVSRVDSRFHGVARTFLGKFNITTRAQRRKKEREEKTRKGKAKKPRPSAQGSSGAPATYSVSRDGRCPIEQRPRHWIRNLNIWGRPEV